MKTKTFTFSKRNLFRLFVTLVFAVSSSVLSAATLTLKADHDGNWSKPGNWNGGKVPTAADNVIFYSSLTNKTMTIQSGTAAVCNQITIYQANLVIASNGSLTVNQSTVAANAFAYPVVLYSASLVNNGTMSVTGNTTASNFTTQSKYFSFYFGNDGSLVTKNSTFENGSTGTLTIDNSGFQASTPNTTYTSTLFYIDQVVAGTTPTVKLNGTLILNLKPYALKAANAVGYQSQLFYVSKAASAVIDGTMTFGTTQAPLANVLAIAGGAATSNISFPFTANLTFNMEGTSQCSTFPGSINNSGIVTFNGPSSTGNTQVFFGLGGLTNSGTFNIIGKTTSYGFGFANTAGTTVVNNSGTINYNSTAGSCFTAYLGPDTTTNTVFQITNSGTINAYGGATSFRIGNDDVYSWFDNSGTINLNGSMSGGTASATTKAPSSMKFYNYGTVNFDANSNTSSLIAEATGTTGYSKMLFKNANLAGTVGGKVKGRGVFLAGSFDNSIGTLSPGCGTTTMTYWPGNTVSTAQVGTANIGQFNIQGTEVVLTGNVHFNVVSPTTAGTTYDQIINSTTSGLFNVDSANVTVSASGAPAATYPLLKATGSSGGSLVGSLAFTTAPTLPSTGGWSVSFASPTVNFISTTTTDITPTGLNSTLSQNGISVINNQLVVKNAAQRISIYSVTGQLLKSFTHTCENLAISLNKGLYVVNIDGQNGKIFIY